MSIYEIKNFKWKINDIKLSPITSASNSSNSTLTPTPRPDGPKGTTLLLSWDAPTVPKEDILAYLIEYQLERATQNKCVSEEEVRLAKYKYPLRGLKFGTYTIHIRLRSPSGYGPRATLIVTLKKQSFHWAVLIAFLCGGMLGIFIIEVALWMRRRRTIRDQRVAQSEAHISSYGELLLKYTLKNEMKEEFVISNDDLQVTEDHKLGEGCFGQVYRGVLNLNSGEQLVAVKTLSEEANPQEMRRFLKEAVIMQGIASNFVVRLIGMVDIYPPYYVVMELMEHGDLKSFLKTKKGKLLTNTKMVEMAVEAADGMAYLEAKKLVHRDLAARNCMLDIGLHLKIGDFGLSRYISSDYYKKNTRGLLPVRWMAPESLKYGRCSTRSDVWSYGVLLWEMATWGMHPYEGILDEQVEPFIYSGLRLPDPDRGPRQFYPLMLECWDFIPVNRPTFKQLVQRLLPSTSKSYPEYFEGVSFSLSSSSCDHNSPDDIDEGFNASGYSQEDAEASCSSVPPCCHRDEDNYFSNEDLETQSKEEDIAVEDDMMCLTSEDPYERSACTPLSCIKGHGGRLTPSSDTPKKNLLFRTPCFIDT